MEDLKHKGKIRTFLQTPCIMQSLNERFSRLLFLQPEKKIL